MTSPDRRQSIAGTAGATAPSPPGRPADAPVSLPRVTWGTSLLVALLLLAASVPVAAQAGALSLVVTVILGLAGGLAVRHPLVAGAVIGLTLTVAVLSGPAHVGPAVLPSCLTIASCAAHGRLLCSITMALWHTSALTAVSVLRGDEAAYTISQVMLWIVLQGGAVLAGAWGRRLLEEAVTERARRLADLSEQRRAIARELHDTGVRAMSHVVMLAENGSRRPEALPEVIEEFRQISETSRRATDEMRILLEQLRGPQDTLTDASGPPRGQEHPLGRGPSPDADADPESDSDSDSAAMAPPLLTGEMLAISLCTEVPLAAHLETMRRRLEAAGFTARAVSEGPTDLDGQQVAVLARCLAEIEANVQRHGDRAAPVAIMTETHRGAPGGSLEVSVAVLNGVSDRDRHGLRGGVGLTGVRERLAAVGGRLETRREGATFLTRIEIEIPGEDL